MADMTLKVAGKDFIGWEKVSVHRGIQLGDSFDVSAIDRWSAEQSPRQIKPGMSASVLLGKDTVITGRIGRARPGWSSEAHEIPVSGRDATGDLVDCAALHKTGEWKNAKLDQIAKDLCAPFGIKVTATADVGAAFKFWRISPGETVQECLHRAARFRGVLLMADGAGGLQIVKSGSGGKAAGSLESGVNILSCDPEFSFDDRFSDYYVRGQSAGSDEVWGADVAQMQGHSVDADLAALKIYRPTVVIADDQGTPASFQTMADMQRSTNAGHGQKIVYTVQDWDVKGVVWKPNTLVAIKDLRLPLKATWLITDVESTREPETGTLTRLTVMPKEAYTTVALPMLEEW